jgi:hypothetical protein
LLLCVSDEEPGTHAPGAESTVGFAW